MLTLYHAPNSRSTSVVQLLHELGITDQVTVREVTIPRQDGTGGRDPANPHPEGKVPCLLHDGAVLTERGCIILYLTNLFPGTGMAPEPGTPEHAAFLTWLFWYGSVMEPVLILDWAKITHPALTAALRGQPEVIARLRAALQKGPWLLGQDYSAADLLCHSPWAWFPEGMPEDELIRDWVARCQARPAAERSRARDAAAMAARVA